MISRTCGRFASSIAMLSAFVITFSERSRRKRIWRAISAVVVPESSMIVSPSWIIWAAAWPMRTFSAWCSVSLTVIGTSSGASPRLSAPPCERTTAPSVGERVEVAADRDRGDGEARDQLLDRDALLVVEQLEDPPPPLLDEQPRRAPLAGAGSVALALPHRGHHKGKLARGAREPAAEPHARA